MVAAAAYRSGERLHDAHHEKTHDYSRRKGVAHAEILAPDHAPDWVTDRGLLWSQVEAMETRKDAQLAREVNMALPHELTHDQRLELVRDFVQRQFVSRGMVADIALHDPVEEKGDHPHNFHAHIMLTLRRATPFGLDPVKTREWNSKELLGNWRESWAAHCNSALRDAGRKARIDSRTLKAQRTDAYERGDYAAARLLDRTPEIHVGPRARQVHARATERGRAVPSTVRPTGSPRTRETGQPPRHRVRDYREKDQGTRVGWLVSLLAGNNAKAKADIAKLERRMARLNRKLDHWSRQADFKIEGAIRGSRFRWLRAQKAAEERAAREAARAEAQRKQAHAAKRAAQVKALIEGLGRGFQMAQQTRERMLLRQRQVSDWARDLGRTAQRALEGPSRDRPGRAR